LDTAIELGATGIGPGIQGLSLAAAEAVREAGLQLNPWTVNRPEQLDIALACRGDTITTDDPAWLHGELDARSLSRRDRDAGAGGQGPASRHRRMMNQPCARSSLAPPSSVAAATTPADGQRRRPLSRERRGSGPVRAPPRRACAG